ncbi:MAG: hypothetical protein WDN26_05710 [Chitinophagaceae bacterium]
MKQRIDIEKRVGDTLGSLDGIRRAAPQPYFYTRLKARMSRENGWSGVARFMARPAFALAMICVVIFVNTWIVFKTDKEVMPSGNNAAANEFPAEYDLTVATLYNYETP